MMLMSYRTLLREAKDRDARLIDYYKKHPRVRQRALAKRFRISQARVNQILKRYKFSHSDNKAVLPCKPEDVGDSLEGCQPYDI